MKRTPIITNEVSEALKKLSGLNVLLYSTAEELGKKVGYSNEEFYKFAKTCDTSGDILQQYKNYTNQASSSTSKFAATLKAVAVNMAIMFTIDLAIKAVTKAKSIIRYHVIRVVRLIYYLVN